MVHIYLRLVGVMLIDIFYGSDEHFFLSLWRSSFNFGKKLLKVGEKPPKQRSRTR